MLRLALIRLPGNLVTGPMRPLEPVEIHDGTWTEIPGMFASCSLRRPRDRVLLVYHIDCNPQNYFYEAHFTIFRRKDGAISSDQNLGFSEEMRSGEFGLDMVFSDYGASSEYPAGLLIDTPGSQGPWTYYLAARSAGRMRPFSGAAVAALGVALVWLTSTAFTSPLAQSPLQQLESRQGFQPRLAASEGSGSFAGQSSTFSSAVAFPGCAVGLATLVTLFGKWSNKHRQRWRKAVNSENRGRQGYKADRRPPLFGPEKPPHEKKKMYHYYCNKIYKVIRFANPDGVEMAPTSQPKTWIEKFSRPGLAKIATIATAICASASLWRQRLL
eukprot:s574_g17.t2